MKHLSELSQLLTKLPRQREEFLGSKAVGRRPDRANELLSGVESGRLTTDLMAIQELYGADVKGAGAYGVLKSRLRARMLNTIFILDPKPPDYSETTQAYFQCHKGLFWASVLLRFGARNIGIKIAKSTLAEAKKFEFTSIELELLFFLRGHYGLTGDAKAYASTNEYLKRTLRMLEVEFRSREYLETITIEFAESEAERPEFASMARGFSDELEVLRRECDNYTIALNYFRVRTFACSIGQDYKEVIAVCDEAEAHLKSRPTLLVLGHLGEFAVQRLIAHLHLRNYEEGKRSAARCAELLSKGNNNWFTYMEYFFLLSMHTAHFAEAREIYHEATTHARFNSLQEAPREKWRVFELYLDYVLRSVKPTSPVAATPSLAAPGSPQPERPKLPRRYDRKKILRLIPTYSRDKQGYNIALLVLHILYLLDQKDYGEIVNRMDALRAYRTRFLKMTTNRRSALFFRLLLIMEANSFEYESTRAQGEKYYKQLLATTSNANEFTEALQVLPFDWLWLHVLEKLRENSASDKGRTQPAPARKSEASL